MFNPFSLSIELYVHVQFILTTNWASGSIDIENKLNIYLSPRYIVRFPQKEKTPQKKMEKIVR
jgi:uncharacterized membrane protein YwzB